MEAMKMKALLLAVLMAASMVQNVAAADGPAPSPTSDAYAAAFVPAVFASAVVLLVGFLF